MANINQQLKPAEELGQKLKQAGVKKKELSVLSQISARTPQAGYRSAEATAGVEALKTPLLVFCGVENFPLMQTSDPRARMSSVVLVEPELDYFKDFLENFDLLSLLRERTVFIVLGDRVDRLGDELECLFGLAASNEVCTVKPIPSRSSQFNEALDSFEKFKQISSSNIDTMDKFLEDWHLNFAANLPRYLSEKNLRSLEGALSGQTALLIGPGPTLEKRRPYIEKLKDRPVIALDTALPTLINIGVEPDFVVSVDVGESNLKYLREIPDSTALVAPAYMRPDVLERAAENYLFEPNFPPATWLTPELDSPGFLAVSGTVAVTAIDLVRLLAPAECFMIGVDLSYPDALAVSRLSPVYNDYVSKLNRFKTLPAQNLAKISEKEPITVEVDGENLLTSVPFYRWRRFFDYLIGEMETKFYRDTKLVLPVENTHPFPPLTSLEENAESELKVKSFSSKTDVSSLKRRLKQFEQDLRQLEMDLKPLAVFQQRNEEMFLNRWLQFTRLLVAFDEVVRYFHWEVDRLTRELQEINSENKLAFFQRQYERWKKLITQTRKGVEQGLNSLE